MFIKFLIIASVVCVNFVSPALTNDLKKPNPRYWADKKASLNGANSFSIDIQYSLDGTKYTAYVDVDMGRAYCNVTGIVDVDGNLERKHCDFGTRGRHVDGTVKTILIDDSETGGNWGGDTIEDPRMKELEKYYILKKRKYDLALETKRVFEQRKKAEAARKAAEQRKKAENILNNRQLDEYFLLKRQQKSKW